MKEPTTPIIEEIIAEGAGQDPEYAQEPTEPFVDAVMLEDGCVCVHIVRPNGIIQNVIIANPEF